MDASKDGGDSEGPSEAVRLELREGKNEVGFGCLDISSGESLEIEEDFSGDSEIFLEVEVENTNSGTSSTDEKERRTKTSGPTSSFTTGLLRNAPPARENALAISTSRSGAENFSMLGRALS